MLVPLTIYLTIQYHTMGVLPSTQSVAAFGSTLVLSSFDLACTCWFGRGGFFWCLVVILAVYWQ